MAESTLSLSRLGFQKSVAQYLGFGTDPTAWEPEEKTQINHCIETGERRVYAPIVLPGEANSHEWSWLQPVDASIVIHAAYATGTVTIVPTAGGSVVTGVGTVFPTWAADAQIVLDGIAYDVLTRTSNTALILDDEDVTAAAGSAYSLQQTTVELPDLFGGFEGDLYFANNGGSVSWFAPLMRVDIDMILHYQQQTNPYTSRPTVYAIHPIAPTGAEFQKQYITVYPASDGERRLTGTMIVNPHKMTEALPYHVGGYALTELLRESCLAAAESEIQGIHNGPHYQLFQQRLIAAIAHDRRQSNPRNLGQSRPAFTWPTSHGMYRPWIGRDWLRQVATAPLTYT